MTTLKTGYAAKKRRQRDIFYKPLSDGFKASRKRGLSDTFMPAQMAEERRKPTTE